MSRTVYVNGSFVPEADAKNLGLRPRFSVRRRRVRGDGGLGRQASRSRKSLLARLDRSLAEMQIAPPLSHAELRALHAELIALNKVDEGVVYLEITRGVADRDFLYPEGVPPTVVAFTQSRPLLDNPSAETGIKVITLPDIRWKRRDIKSTALLAQTMGKQEAKRRGAYEAWMVENGFVTEGTSSTAFILDVNGTMRTQPLGHHILPGVTRRAVLRLAQEEVPPSRSGPSRWRRRCRRAKPSSPLPQPSCCRWLRSTGSRSATGARGRSRESSAAFTSRKRAKANSSGTVPGQQRCPLPLSIPYTDGAVGCPVQWCIQAT